MHIVNQDHVLLTTKTKTVLVNALVQTIIVSYRDLKQ